MRGSLHSAAKPRALQSLVGLDFEPELAALGLKLRYLGLQGNS